MCLNKMTDPDSNDGVSPEIWGPPTWRTIHFIAAHFPLRPTPHDRDHFRAFIAQLPHVLPCDECKQHAVRLLAQLPPSVDSRDRLFDWSVEFHNRVNDRIGVPRLSLDAARTAYGLTPHTLAPVVIVTPVPRNAAVSLGQIPAIQQQAKPQQPVRPQVQPRYVPPRHMGYNPSTMGHNQSRQFYSQPAAMRAPPAGALPAPQQQQPTRQFSAGLQLPPGISTLAKSAAPKATSTPGSATAPQRSISGMPGSVAPSRSMVPMIRSATPKSVAPATLPTTNRTPGKKKCNCGKK